MRYRVVLRLVKCHTGRRCYPGRRGSDCGKCDDGHECELEIIRSSTNRLSAAEPEKVREAIEEGLAIPADDAVLASGKTGEGIHDLLESIVYKIPAPQGDPDAPLRALIFDSYFDPYRGVVALIRVVDGRISEGDRVHMIATKTDALVEEVGARRPVETALPSLGVGEVGYLVTGLKEVSKVKVGDTITTHQDLSLEALPGYREAKPMVFTGLFPLDGDQYEPLKEAFEKLSLNDPALIWEPETSHALGFGFRVGFLGFFIWRLSRSASSGSLTSIFWQQRPR